MRIIASVISAAVLVVGGAAAAVVDGVPAAAAAPATVTFGFTGGVQTWVVPPDVTSITIDAQGGQGAVGGLGTIAAGGRGGRTVATVAANPGETLQVFVGGRGGAPTGANCAAATAGPAGFNGGAAGGRCAGGGGGGSDVRFTPYSTAQRLVAAAGGGGGSGSEISSAASGGAGGGVTGADGGAIGACAAPVNGGRTGAGGPGDGDGTAGAVATGGTGGTTVANGGGGGGGGLFGGGGGASLGFVGSGCASGGGGGSAGVIANATGVSVSSGTRAGDGTVTITYSTLDVTPSTLPDATIGVGYSASFTATGGTPPYTFTFTDGSLPAGLDLAADGTLSGTPTALGRSTFTVTVQDAAGHQGSVSATVTVGAAVEVLAAGAGASSGPTLPATGNRAPVGKEALTGVVLALIGVAGAEIGRRRRPTRACGPRS